MIHLSAFRRRPGSIYGVRVIHERTGRVVTAGYIGKTRQRVGDRIDQHLTTKPWRDLVIDHYVIRTGNRVSGWTLWWWEVWAIVSRFPLYNYQWNRHNPRRIPMYIAAERRRSPACRAALAARRQASVRQASRRPYRWGGQRVG